MVGHEMTYVNSQSVPMLHFLDRTIVTCESTGSMAGPLNNTAAAHLLLVSLLCFSQA